MRPGRVGGRGWGGVHPDDSLPVMHVYIYIFIPTSEHGAGSVHTVVPCAFTQVPGDGDWISDGPDGANAQKEKRVGNGGATAPHPDPGKKKR